MHEAPGSLPGTAFRFAGQDGHKGKCTGPLLLDILDLGQVEEVIFCLHAEEKPGWARHFLLQDTFHDGLDGRKATASGNKDHGCLALAQAKCPEGAGELQCITWLGFLEKPCGKPAAGYQANKEVHLVLAIVMVLAGTGKGIGARAVKTFPVDLGILARLVGHAALQGTTQSDDAGRKPFHLIDTRRDDAHGILGDENLDIGPGIRLAGQNMASLDFLVTQDDICGHLHFSGQEAYLTGSASPHTAVIENGNVVFQRSVKQPLVIGHLETPAGGVNGYHMTHIFTILLSSSMSWTHKNSP